MEIRLDYTLFGFSIFAISVAVAYLARHILNLATIDPWVWVTIFYSFLGIIAMATFILAFNFVGGRLIKTYKKEAH